MELTKESGIQIDHNFGVRQKVKRIRMGGENLGPIVYEGSDLKRLGVGEEAKLDQRYSAVSATTDGKGVISSVVFQPEGRKPARLIAEDAIEQGIVTSTQLNLKDMTNGFLGRIVTAIENRSSVVSAPNRAVEIGALEELNSALDRKEVDGVIGDYAQRLRAIRVTRLSWAGCNGELKISSAIEPMDLEAAAPEMAGKIHKMKKK